MYITLYFIVCLDTVLSGYSPKHVTVNINVFKVWHGTHYIIDVSVKSVGLFGKHEIKPT